MRLHFPFRTPCHVANLLLGAIALIGVAERATGAEKSERTNPSVVQLIPWLLDEDRQLGGIPFSEVILAATGKRVLAFDPKSETDQGLSWQISDVLDEVLKRMNAPDCAVQKVGRINEVSIHVENLFRELLSAIPGLNCDFPRTGEGRVQRSGYPDLRIADTASNRTFISTQNFTPPAAATAVSTRSI